MFLIEKKNKKQIEFIMTIVAPVGKSYTKEINTPNITENVDTIDDIRIVFLKLFDICKAVTVGKIIILEINIVPTTLIPKTIVMDVNMDVK